MILDNRTRYRSADLERVILLALEEAGITSHARDRVLVHHDRTGRHFSGWCYFGFVTPGKLQRGGRKPRMVLRLPDPDPKPTWNERSQVGGFCPTHQKVACKPDGEPSCPPYEPGSRFMRCPHGCRWIQTPYTPSEPQTNLPLDVALFVWLVRHEVGHWRGLDHKQMHPLMRWRKEWLAAGRPLPEWAADVTVALENAKPEAKKKPTPRSVTPCARLRRTAAPIDRSDSSTRG